MYQRCGVEGLRDVGVDGAGEASQGPSNLCQKSTFEDFVYFRRNITAQWLQERANGSENEHRITPEGPRVAYQNVVV